VNYDNQQSTDVFPGGSKRRTEGDIRREFAELVAHHLLGNGHVMIDLAVVYLELETNEVGQDCG
jgi:hypothetical protein